MTMNDEQVRQWLEKEADSIVFARDDDTKRLKWVFVEAQNHITGEIVAGNDKTLTGAVEACASALADSYSLSV